MRRIGIIGLGLIGGSLAKALRRVDAGLEIAGVDRSDQIAQEARAVGAVDWASNELNILGDVDIAVIATPVDQIAGVVDSLRRIKPAPSLITDVASVKQAVVALARSLPHSSSFLGGHPVAGKEQVGLEASDPDIFAGRPWIFTPAQGQDLAPFAPWFDLVRAIGSQPVFMPAAEHDRQMAYLSHLAFTLSSAYAETAVRAANPDLAGPGFASMTRLAAGDAAMYEAICRENRKALLEAIDEFTKVLALFRERIAKGDRVRELFTETVHVAV